MPLSTSQFLETDFHYVTQCGDYIYLLLTHQNLESPHLGDGPLDLVVRDFLDCI